MTDRNGQTALVVAEHFGNEDIVQDLKRASKQTTARPTPMTTEGVQEKLTGTFTKRVGVNIEAAKRIINRYCVVKAR